jgi:hypothetical protein
MKGEAGEGDMEGEAGEDCEESSLRTIKYALFVIHVSSYPAF